MDEKLRSKPSYMKNQVAFGLWKKFIKHFEEIEQGLTEEDYLMLEQLCSTYSFLRESQKSLDTDGVVYKVGGYIKKNPAFDVYVNCQTKLIQILSEMKLTAKSKGFIEELDDAPSFKDAIKLKFDALGK